MNETGLRIREQYADTGGFTDHVFAACSILGYAFVPRIRDLPSKRLYVFDRAGVPKLLRPLVGGKVNVDLIDRNWADILRVAATMAAGTLRPSQILRKLAAYPRQNELAAALPDGRVSVGGTRQYSPPRGAPDPTAPGVVGCPLVKGTHDTNPRGTKNRRACGSACRPARGSYFSRSTRNHGRAIE